VVAPASTLHNWQQEITRFVPGLKALPYWGNVKDRATLRKFWSKKEISYNQDAPFHILITSYQLVCQPNLFDIAQTLNDTIRLRKISSTFNVLNGSI
jgi:SNF2 family DNA or RNA helicase